MVWAAFPTYREIFNLKLLAITRDEAEFDEWYQEWSDPGPWMAFFGKQYEGYGAPGTVHNPECHLSNVFTTKEEARKCVYDYCMRESNGMRMTAEMWAKIAEEWK